MSEYPLHLVRERRLADGRTVRIRPIRAEDEPAEREFLAQLSGEDRRRRFLQLAGVANRALAHFHAHVDYDRHMAFVCEAEENGARRLVGDARYVANPGGRSCELGIVVADEWRHSGVAHLLLDALVRAARARGFDTMEGFVLRDNRDMLGFAHAQGFEVCAPPEQPELLRIVKRL